MREIEEKRAWGLANHHTELISDVLNRLKWDGGGRGEGSGVRADGHTSDRKHSCQTFVREGVKEKGGKIPLLVIDAEVASTRED